MKGYTTEKYLIVDILYTDYTSIGDTYSNDWKVSEAVNDMITSSFHQLQLKRGKEIKSILVRRTTEYTKSEH